jgi:hypothetical protein
VANWKGGLIIPANEVDSIPIPHSGINFHAWHASIPSEGYISDQINQINFSFPIIYDIIFIRRRNDMPLTKRKSEEVRFPLSVFETADTKEDLEDWLLSQNPEFIKKMRKARREDILGKGKSWESIKRELCIK